MEATETIRRMGDVRDWQRFSPPRPGTACQIRGDAPIPERRPIAAACPAVAARGGYGRLGHPARGINRPDGLARTAIRSPRGCACGLRRAPGGRRRGPSRVDLVATPLAGRD